MAIEHLSDEEIQTMSLAEKDRWWLDKVFKGDMPQLTVRSAATGMILGGVLSLTNLYVGVKTGWTLGVGITSVILAFSMWKVFQKIGVKSEFSLLENNCMQSIATSAGYMTAPLISSLTAYMWVTNTQIPMWQCWLWIVSIGVLGVLFAFPLKRRFINDEQHPFPEGRAAGVVMDALYEGDEAAGLLKGKILAITSGAAALLTILKSDKITERLYIGFLRFPDTLDGWIYDLTTLKIGGTDLRQLSVMAETDFVMFAAGGLMGIRTGTSILIGAAINYLWIAPMVIGWHDIHPRVDAEGVVQAGVFGFGQITKWALWPGVACMTTASLFAFFSKPKIIIDSFKAFFQKKQASTDEATEAKMKEIELPMNVFAIGIPIVGGIVVALAWWFFGVEIWMGIIAVPMIFVFTLIAVNSTALTSITPTGALGKLTQLTYGVLAPGNMTTNLMTAGITGEVAGNASNLLMDIKPGYMLGGKPRQQAIGHVLGIIAGASVAVPVFFLVFVPESPTRDSMVTNDYPFTAAAIWHAVAELLTQGLENLPVSARWGALIGAIVGLTLETLKTVTKGKFWISGVGIGLAFVIPFSTCLAMFAGAFFFWLFEKNVKSKTSWAKRVIVDNVEPICAGVIAGGALTGILVIVLENFVLTGS
ncbi:MAG: OPT/YSL family transporter [Myxococcales bacterium]|nr:OPT/YSL family transporter [Myxococcales bacterium]